MKYYIYYESTLSGFVDFVDVADSKKEAVNKIALCYKKDRERFGENEYFYYFKEH